MAFATAVLSPASAQAQRVDVNITTFFGAAMVPDSHGAVGVAVGFRPRVGTGTKRPVASPVSVEIEYSSSRSDVTAGVPAVSSLSGNLLFQFPLRPARVVYYVTFGAGAYGLQLGGHISGPNDARNFGGGAKLRLVGPLKARVDYRAFSLAPIGGWYHSNEHRVTVGVVAGF